jgi:hypothetical protein
MKRDIPTQAGIGLALIIATATFIIAIVAGIFLIYEPEIMPSDAQTYVVPPSQVSIAQTRDAERLRHSHD